MEITSTQRGHERYQLLYVWQILEQIVPNNGAVRTKWGNRGRMIIIPRSRGSQAIRTLRDSSFTVKSGRLFNALLRYLRDYSGEKTTVNSFKRQLDLFLELIPDHPRDTVGGWLPQAMDQITGMNSSSLLHWCIHLRKTNPEFAWR